MTKGEDESFMRTDTNRKLDVKFENYIKVSCDKCGKEFLLVFIKAPEQ